MINIKRVILWVLIGSIGVLALRQYTLAWAMESTYFGCQEAALKEYRFFSVEDGNRLSQFCDARRIAIKEYWDK